MKCSQSSDISLLILGNLKSNKALREQRDGEGKRKGLNSFLKEKKNEKECEQQEGGEKKWKSENEGGEIKRKWEVETERDFIKGPLLEFF